jgi:hypothetical protein
MHNEVDKFDRTVWSMVCRGSYVMHNEVDKFDRKVRPVSNVRSGALVMMHNGTFYVCNLEHGTCLLMLFCFWRWRKLRPATSKSPLAVDCMNHTLLLTVIQLWLQLSGKSATRWPQLCCCTLVLPGFVCADRSVRCVILTRCRPADKPLTK